MHPHPVPPLHLALEAGTSLSVLAVLESALHLPLLTAPLAASAVLLATAPEGPLATPRAVVGGYVLAALVGLLLSPWAAFPLVPGLAVGLALLLMLATRTLHLPACAAAFLALHTAQGWTFVLTPVLTGAVALVLTHALLRALVTRFRPLPALEGRASAP